MNDMNGMAYELTLELRLLRESIEGLRNELEAGRTKAEGTPHAVANVLSGDAIREYFGCSGQTDGASGPELTKATD